MMRAEPFQYDGTKNGAMVRFRDHLQELFSHNKNTAEKVEPNWSADDQITAEMNRIRSLKRADRTAYYSEMRITNQQAWYAKKARWNKKRSTLWSVAVVAAYIAAAGLSLARLRFPEWQNWPIDPIIVVASSMIGWVQIKKFSELSVAYKVTAMEISLISPKLKAVSTDNEFSEFVSEAELAFSREHTMWIARQTS
jgi:SMODS and SLOG-associating 2TM effector domain 1